MHALDPSPASAVAPPDVIELLHQADWTRLNLTAATSDGSSVAIAPGGRYWMKTGEYTTCCDGQRAWSLESGESAWREEPPGFERWFGGREPPLSELLCPAGLLERSRLEVLGRTSYLGRDAVEIVVTVRPPIGVKPKPGDAPADRTDALVDAELGILLWLSRPVADGEPHVIGLTSLEVDPPADPERFAPPPDSEPAAGTPEGGLADLPRSVLKMAAGLVAGAVGLLIRHSPMANPDPDPAFLTDGETELGRDEPVPRLAPDGRPVGPPVTRDVLRLLQRGGPQRFTGTLHQWYAVSAMLSKVPASARGAGFGGVGLLVDSITRRIELAPDRTTVAHLEATVELAGAEGYRIGYLAEVPGGPRRGQRAIACDGQRRWRVYRDKVTVGPAAPPPGYLTELADPSWLLTCWLAGGEPVIFAGRPAYRLLAASGRAGHAGPLLFPAAIAIVDAELGVLLQLTSYLHGEPVERLELRDPCALDEAFRMDIPSDLPVSADTSLAARIADHPPRPGEVPVRIAGAIARFAGDEALRTTRGIWRRLGGQAGSGPAGPSDQARRGNLPKSGARLALNASRPSLASSEA